MLLLQWQSVRIFGSGVLVLQWQPARMSGSGVLLLQWQPARMFGGGVLHLQWQPGRKKSFSRHMHLFLCNSVLKENVLLRIEVCEGPVKLMTRSSDGVCTICDISLL